MIIRTLEGCRWERARISGLQGRQRLATPLVSLGTLERDPNAREIHPREHGLWISGARLLQTGDCPFRLLGESEQQAEEAQGFAILFEIWDRLDLHLRRLKPPEAHEVPGIIQPLPPGIFAKAIETRAARGAEFRGQLWDYYIAQVAHDVAVIVLSHHLSPTGCRDAASRLFI